MTLYKLAGLGLLSSGLLFGLTACDGDKADDTNTPADDSDEPADDDLDDDGLTNDEEEQLGTDPEEADTDGDGCDDKDEIDEGHDPLDDTDDCEYFEATVMFVNVRAAYDGSGLTGYSGLDGNGDPFTQETPWVEIQLVTDDYFDTGDDRYACTWLGNVVPAGGNYLPTDFGVDDLYLGYEVMFELVVAEDGTPQTDCFDFDPAVWGEAGDPSSIIEATTWGVGYAPMSTEFVSTLETAVSDAGLDWDADWAPYVFSFYLGFPGESGAVEVGEIGYVFGYELDESLTFVTDEAGEDVLREMGPEGTVEELPVNTYLGAGSLYGYYTYGITGE